MNASRIGLRRRDFRDRERDWRADGLETKDEDAGGVYSKGEPSVVETAVRELGTEGSGKLKGVVYWVVSGVGKLRNEYAGVCAAASASASVDSPPYAPRD